MKIEEILLTLGCKIRELRKQKNLSQEVFADKANIERAYFGYIERGKKNISIILLMRIAKVLEVSPSDLFPDYESLYPLLNDEN